MIRRVASKPLSSGMAMSMTTTSGRSCFAIWTAWRPFSASPTMAMSGSASKSTWNPCRTMAWSSASRTVILLIRTSLFQVEGNFHGHGSSSVGLGFDSKTAIDQAHALLHAQQAQPFFSFCRDLLLHFESFAVVGDLNPEGVFELAQSRGYLSGLGMFGHIGQAFLSH